MWFIGKLTRSLPDFLKNSNEQKGTLCCDKLKQIKKGVGDKILHYKKSRNVFLVINMRGRVLCDVIVDTGGCFNTRISSGLGTTNSSRSSI